ncbi:TetR/AcrR family transcriptional regulator [Actinophytocola sp.]|uniref:TetR/AcrR family transcriptional regulator n=1 Tax=Actinophytocola sp. TaxID=1872138 RepID=UPI002D80143C|nr:TetR family transcriptional regulator [Actinophytocola sp.]HET9139715.1 TetR family transcriptional regulator [Actinophytocola sp.]
MADTPAQPRRPRRSPGAGERQRDPERTKARILDAAKAEFGAKGFAAARISDIADRAGVNKQLISYYFGGKEGLYTELADRWRETSAAMARPEAPLDAVVAGFVMSTVHDWDWARLMAWVNMSGSAEQTPASEAEAQFMRAQVTELKNRQAAGEIPADLDPGCLLLALFAAASATVTLPRIAELISGADPQSATFTSRYAEQLALLVRHLQHPA